MARDAAGTWQVKLAGDTGAATGALKLVRDGNKLSGTVSGDMGRICLCRGPGATATWSSRSLHVMDDKSQSTAHLAGWVDGASAEGRMEIVGRRWNLDRGEAVAALLENPTIGCFDVRPSRTVFSNGAGRSFLPHSLCECVGLRM